MQRGIQYIIDWVLLNKTRTMRWRRWDRRTLGAIPIIFACVNSISEKMSCGFVWNSARVKWGKKLDFSSNLVLKRGLLTRASRLSLFWWRWRIYGSITITTHIMNDWMSLWMLEWILANSFMKFIITTNYHFNDNDQGQVGCSCFSPPGPLWSRIVFEPWWQKPGLWEMLWRLADWLTSWLIGLFTDRRCLSVCLENFLTVEEWAMIWD